MASNDAHSLRAVPDEAERVARRRRREERRAKQRKQNSVRAQAMHTARLAYERTNAATMPALVRSATTKSLQVHVGCSGWFYWHWREAFYPPGLPTTAWFRHYATQFGTVELNAPFYSWPTVATVHTWRRQATRRRFVYTIKVNELITHVRRFSRTGALVKDFGLIADLLGSRFGCFLFQLPPSLHYNAALLRRIVMQLDPKRRNVVEFRHPSWWNNRVYDTFAARNIVFCSVSAPRLPDDLIKTGDEIYIRFHGPQRWYRHDYSDRELAVWAERIRASGAKRAWAYFNNDREANALKNARTLLSQLKRRNWRDKR
jgi:uncharacterized protein YecE (DUF72 family)